MVRPSRPRGLAESASGFVGFLRASYLTLDTRWLGIFRILFGTLLCVEVLRRWAEVRAFYCNDGVLPNHFALYRPLGSDVFSIYTAFSTVGEVSVAFALTLIVFFLFTIGYKTRAFHVLSVVCITSLDSRNIFVENGGTVLLNVLALWTLFLPLGRRLSIDSVLRSLRSHTESIAAELNRPRERPNRHVSLVALALILQWSVIYYFNTVHKDGVGWRDGSALHWFWHQDRIVTWLSVWAREHVPLGVVHVLTYGTLVVEGTLAFLLLVPFWQTRLRRVALTLALGLHGTIALSARLGPFSYVMVMFFVMLLGQRDWELLGRWFGKPSRARVVVYDGDCGICFQLCRILVRLDPFQRLRFVANHDEDALPPAVAGIDLERTLAVVTPAGEAFVQERAVFEVVRALPFGILLVWWLRLPGLAALGRRLYRRLADNRMQVSSWFGLGVCGAPAVRTERQGSGLAQDQALAVGVSESSVDVSIEPEADRVASTAKEPPAEPPTLRGEARAALVLLRESAVVLLMIVMGSQLALENRALRRFVRVSQPEWMAHVVRYPRTGQGWSMFAPEPPYEDGHLVVDGRTADGRKLDPLTGRAPDFDPYTPEGWGLSQLWCDFHNRISFPGNAGYRQHLRNYLLNLHSYRGRPDERLVAFDVWWVRDRSPPPGRLRGEPLPPQRLVSYGRVSDSGATPRLNGDQSPSKPRLVPHRPLLRGAP